MEKMEPPRNSDFSYKTRHKSHVYMKQGAATDPCPKLAFSIKGVNQAMRHNEQMGTVTGPAHAALCRHAGNGNKQHHVLGTEPFAFLIKAKYHTLKAGKEEMRGESTLERLLECSWVWSKPAGPPEC